MTLQDKRKMSVGGGKNTLLSIGYLEANCGKDFAVQEFLEQHEFINQFCSTSVNTLRLTLYRSVKDDECVVPSAIMRIGHEGSCVDNAHAGGGYVSIDVSTGKLGKEVFDQYGQRYSSLNRIDFNKGYQLPTELWKKVLDFAKSIGSFVPHHRLLALDLAIDKEGNPKMIEFNIEYYGIWPFQFSQCPAFGDYTDEIIDYCRKERSKLEYMMLL